MGITCITFTFSGVVELPQELDIAYNKNERHEHNVASSNKFRRQSVGINVVLIVHCFDLYFVSIVIVLVYMQVYIDVYIYICIYVYSNTHIYIYIYMYILAPSGPQISRRNLVFRQHFHLEVTSPLDFLWNYLVHNPLTVRYWALIVCLWACSGRRLDSFWVR